MSVEDQGGLGPKWGPDYQARHPACGAQYDWQRDGHPGGAQPPCSKPRGHEGGPASDFKRAEHSNGMFKWPAEATLASGEPALVEHEAQVNDRTVLHVIDVADPDADARFEELLEASSLGTPGAKALRARTSPETAAAVVARSREIAAEAGE